MDHGETPWECALRECLEETGIAFDPEEHSEVRVHSVREWEALMSPSNFARLREIDAARRTGTVAYMER
ncbi:NUDIX domain-containing protein [Streptomyces sp. NPDC058401]|uniref:NUDIX domain-containing protein n=1 Tax=Streptomyces sp. NPDC058401 TaxID=3346480 RepID=UPI003662E423